MIERRIFTKIVVDSNDFLDMPQLNELLYFHLAMIAGDDVFINKPKNF